MRVARIHARNIKMFDSDFDLQPKKVTAIMGKNGTGKTSVLSVLTGCLGPGDPRILRTGAEEGEIVIVLEDDGESFEVRRTFRPGKASQPKVKSSKVGTIGAPATWLKQVLDAVSMDPIREAMNAKEDRQAQILLETLPLDLDFNEVIAAAQDVAVPAQVLQRAKTMQALDAIKAVYDYIYDLRRDITRDAKKARIQAEQLRATLTAQAGDAENWSAVAAQLLRQMNEVSAEEGRQQATAERDYGTRKQGLAQHISRLAHEIDEEIDARIRALEAERRERKADLDRAEKLELEKLADAHQRRLAEISEKARPERERLSGEHAKAQERASREAQDQQTERIAAQNEAEATTGEQTSKRITAALKNLDGVRERLMEKLPIKGLKVEAGIPYLNGVPLSEVNTQQRGMFWLRIAVMRAGELGLVVADGCECFDPENFNALLSGAHKIPDVQFFFGRVDGEPFRIETV